MERSIGWVETTARLGPVVVACVGILVAIGVHGQLAQAAVMLGLFVVIAPAWNFFINTVIWPWTHTRGGAEKKD